MNDVEVTRAIFEIKNGPAAGTRIPVQFNPASLNHTVSNTLSQRGTNTKARQFISSSSARLSMELIYDTTGDGEDVRAYTGAFAALMRPVADQNGDATKQSAPVLKFEWGRFVFTGMLDTFQETIDFFSADGVPLRSTVQIGLVDQEPIKDEDASAADSGVVVVPLGAGDSAFSLSARAGAPAAAGALAALNGQASVRFGAGGALAIGGAADLRGPVAFASAGASAGLGIGVSGGASLSAAGGFGARASASAGVTASAGAFAQLGVSAGARAGATARIDPGRVVARAEIVAPATDRGALFAVGGQASVIGSSSLRANVGASLRARLDFDA